MAKVDARGLSCPQPVMLTRQAMASGDFPIEVLVDTVTARENVRRMAELAHCQVTVEQVGDEYRVVVKK